MIPLNLLILYFIFFVCSLGIIIRQHNPQWRRGEVHPPAPLCELGGFFFIIMRLNQCFCLEVSEGGRQSVRKRRLEDGGPYPSHTSDPQFAILSQRSCEVSGLPTSLLPLPVPVVCRFPIAGEAKAGPGKTERESEREGRTWFQPSGPVFNSC